MATPATALQSMTVAQYEALIDVRADLEHTELVNGVIVEMGTAPVLHEVVKSNLGSELALYCRQSGGWRVLQVSMFILNEANARIPDISVISAARLKSAPRNARFKSAPELAIEIVSSESASDLEEKVRLLFQTRSKAIWIVYPLAQTVHTYRPGGYARRLEVTETLDEPTLLPGFSIPIARLFE